MRIEQLTDMMLQVHQDGHRARVGMHTLDSGPLDGRSISIDGQVMVNFSSCGFLGLEFDARLRQGAIDALARYGTQFSCSRSYMSVSLYEELESKLSTMMGRPVIATPSTTLGHFSALPALVASDDAIILDQHVHASMQQATSTLKGAGVHVETVRHCRMDKLDARLLALKNKHRRVWYLADGVYSMYGSRAPFEAMTELLARHEHLHLYVDDAHGFGWTGRYGRGVAASALPNSERIVFAASLNKSFAAAGGLIALPSQAWADRVRQGGRNLTFSGPIQPPMLGAAIASADLHLSDELPTLQADLARKIALTNEVFAARGIPLADDNDTPVFFVPTGIPTVVYSLVRALMLDGFQVSSGIFPALPMARGGLRFTVTRHITEADIEGLADRVAYHHPRVLHAHGSSRAHLARAFKTSGVAASLQQPQPEAPTPGNAPKEAPKAAPTAGTATVSAVTSEPGPTAVPDSYETPTGLRVHVRRSIDAVDPAFWDGMFAARGPMGHAVQRAMESSFSGNEGVGQNFEWRYVWVTDAAGEVVAATYFSIGWIKDDSFASAEISTAAESVRASEDPMHLVSKSVVSGSPLSLGDHLHLAAEHPARADALRALVDLSRALKDEVGASQVLLRDFEEGATARELSALGFADVPIPPMMLVESMGWDSRESYLRGLSGKNRYSVRREILAREHLFELEVGAPSSEMEMTRCDALYRAVHRRGRRLNVFALPARALSNLMVHPEFDVLRLYARGLDNGDRQLVSFMLSHRASGRYTALLVGLDDAFRDRGAYKQILFHAVQRGNALGATVVNLAFTAELEKRKLGAVKRARRVLLAADDDFSARAMMSMG